MCYSSVYTLTRSKYRCWTKTTHFWSQTLKIEQHSWKVRMYGYMFYLWKLNWLKKYLSEKKEQRHLFAMKLLVCKMTLALRNETTTKWDLVLRSNGNDVFWSVKITLRSFVKKVTIWVKCHNKSCKPERLLQKPHYVLLYKKSVHPKTRPCTTTYICYRDAMRSLFSTGGRKFVKLPVKLVVISRREKKSILFAILKIFFIKILKG